MFSSRLPHAPVPNALSRALARLRERGIPYIDLTEKVETKGGWQFPSPDEDWMRGYPQEMEDFVDAVREGREPLSGLLLAHEIVEVIYAAYVSAEEGRRVELVR
ncbi:MAG: hypothetical protein HY712_00570 [candidate division NC10 bacterium]|nr:hypothetical protein [candidate division NC10 bacterium]